MGRCWRGEGGREVSHPMESLWCVLLCVASCVIVGVVVVVNIVVGV